MRNQSWNISWKLRSHLGKHLLVIPPPTPFLLIGGTWGEGIPVSTRVGAPVICGSPGSPTLTTESPTSLMKHTRPLPGELFLVLHAHTMLFHTSSLLLKCPCSPHSPGVVLLRLQGSVGSNTPSSGRPALTSGWLVSKWGCGDNYEKRQTGKWILVLAFTRCGVRWTFWTLLFPMYKIQIFACQHYFED